MSDNANSFSNDSTSAPVLEARESTGCVRTPGSDRLSSVRETPPTGHRVELQGFSRNEDPTIVLKSLLNEYRERNRQQDRELNTLRQQFDGALTVQDRLGQRISELGSFALLAYRGSPIQVFPGLYEIIDGMFTRLYEATIRVHSADKEAALSSLESLMSRMEVLQSFLRRTEAVARLFVGEETDRRQNERFLLGNIPPQVTIPSFASTMDRTRLPYPVPRRSSSRNPVTPPNSPASTVVSGPNGRKRSRVDDLEEGELPAKRRC
ncbi:hypothetical protein K435DRAFT_858464 [Dendrothele bispora CBS 962.96]|uniref:Uncharacterized protein n=1 Tax=Dendrothele bispora (strain CBS 962.96) TaxID=1314807 RepID=A0A4S8M3M2_DENBC|nr:hypothetical protein K435DRAFT_858464 [Dendrothele bispora CBS 962.96]